MPQEGEGPADAPPSSPGGSLVVPIVLTSPTSPVLSQANLLSISGICLQGTTVVLGGNASGSLGCNTGTFTFVVPKVVDGTFSFSLVQGFSTTRVSDPVTVTWTRDTTA